MKISTKGRYALRMMIDLAEHQGDGFIALKDIAQRQNISKKYLEQIVPILNRSSFLRTNRGYQGGYRLAREPRAYTCLLYTSQEDCKISMAALTSSDTRYVGCRSCCWREMVLSSGLLMSTLTPHALRPARRSRAATVSDVYKRQHMNRSERMHRKRARSWWRSQS